MRAQEYKDAEAVVSKLHDVVTNSNRINTVISSSTMEDKYKLIAEQRTKIPADKIKRIYTLGKVDDVYVILVVYSNTKTRDIIAQYANGIVQTSSIQRNYDYFDACILFAGDDIYTDLSVAYNVLYDIFMPHPSEDVYYMFCFLSAFKGVYTEEDLKKIAIGMSDVGIDTLQLLVSNYHSMNYILNEEDIANAIKAVRSKNKDNETK